jgi:hypothetical protein
MEKRQLGQSGMKDFGVETIDFYYQHRLTYSNDCQLRDWKRHTA